MIVLLFYVFVINIIEGPDFESSEEDSDADDVYGNFYFEILKSFFLKKTP